MRKTSGLLVFVVVIGLLCTGCEDPTGSSSGSSSVNVTMQYYDFSYSNIDLNVSMGAGGTSGYYGTYVIYTENRSSYADGLSLHFLVPGSIGSMAEPGPEWLVIKIQKDAMRPGTYTLDDSDPNYQLSEPGQVKLYYNDADDVLHVGSGQITINYLDWSNSGSYTASLSVSLSLDNVTLGSGTVYSVAGTAMSDTGTVTGSFEGQASISGDDSGGSSLVGTRWRGNYNYYGTPVTETLHFTSSSSCTGTTEAGGDSITITMSYTYDPGSRTGTLTADSTASFSINSAFTILTFNGVSYDKQ